MNFHSFCYFPVIFIISHQLTVSFLVTEYVQNSLEDAEYSAFNLSTNMTHNHKLSLYLRFTKQFMNIHRNTESLRIFINLSQCVIILKHNSGHTICADVFILSHIRIFITNKRYHCIVSCAGNFSVFSKWFSKYLCMHYTRLVLKVTIRTVWLYWMYTPIHKVCKEQKDNELWFSS